MKAATLANWSIGLFGVRADVEVDPLMDSRLSVSLKLVVRLLRVAAVAEEPVGGRSGFIVPILLTGINSTKLSGKTPIFL